MPAKLSRYLSLSSLSSTGVNTNTPHVTRSPRLFSNGKTKPKKRFLKPSSSFNLLKAIQIMIMQIKGKMKPIIDQMISFGLWMNVFSFLFMLAVIYAKNVEFARHSVYFFRSAAASIDSLSASNELSSCFSLRLNLRVISLFQAWEKRCMPYFSS